MTATERLTAALAVNSIETLRAEQGRGENAPDLHDLEVWGVSREEWAEAVSAALRLKEERDALLEEREAAGAWSGHALDGAAQRFKTAVKRCDELFGTDHLGAMRAV